MFRYLAFRLLGLLFNLVIISVITFGLMHVIPGSPFDAGVASQGVILAPEVRLQLLQKYNLDKPVWVQYISYMWHALHLDFGDTFSGPNETVMERITRTWPVSLHLGAMAVIAAVPFGLFLGIVSARHPDTCTDYVLSAITAGGIAFPSFVIGLLLLTVFSVLLHWLPTGGWETPRNWLLPVLSLTLAPAATVARYTRASILECLPLDYVRTACAKGLKKGTILVRHVLPNALLPVLTITGPIAVDLVVGSFFIETVFRVPGLGRYFTLSVFARDYPMIMGTTLFLATLVGAVNLLTDLLYTWIDPRVRLEL